MTATEQIREIIKKQAEAVKNRPLKIKMAEAYEAEARNIREDANKIPRIPKGLLTQQRLEKLERFGNARKKVKQEQAHRLLAAAGWSRGMHNEAQETSTYGLKSKPGYLLTIKGDTFSVVNGADIKQPKTPIDHLGGYLDTIKPQK